ncbi:MAG TPA: hypothetical protein PLS84_03290 [Salinivirgaceae bacterium]|nr:hypothetical protein [Salinivirgaceae bacterium]
MSKIFIEDIVLEQSRQFVLLPSDINTLLSVAVFCINIDEVLISLEIENNHYDMINRKGLELNNDSSFKTIKTPLNIKIRNNHMFVSIKTHNTNRIKKKKLKIVCEYD